MTTCFRFWIFSFQLQKQVPTLLDNINHSISIFSSNCIKQLSLNLGELKRTMKTFVKYEGSTMFGKFWMFMLNIKICSFKTSLWVIGVSTFARFSLLLTHPSTHGKSHGVVSFLLFTKMNLFFMEFFDDVMLSRIRRLIIVTPKSIT